MGRRNEPEGIENILGSPASAVGVAGSGGTPPVSPDQERHARVIVEICVGAVAGRTTQGVERLRMPVGFLADVERRQRHSERREPAKNIGEPAIRDHVVTRLPQRLRAQSSRCGSSRLA